MNDETRRELTTRAQMRAIEFPPDAERSVARGADAHRRRVRRIYTVAIVVIVLLTAGLLILHPAIGLFRSPAVASVALDPGEATLTVGGSLTLDAVVLRTDGSSAPRDDLAWESSRELVATVTDGRVVALSEGTVTILASAGGVVGFATVRVLPPLATPPDAIALNPSSPRLLVGEEQSLTATGTYEDAEPADVTNSAVWTSSDDAVATVDESGVVRGVSPGVAQIRAAVGDVAGAASVTVEAVRSGTLVALRIDPAQIDMRAGTSQQLGVTGEYSDGTTASLRSDVVWSTDSDEVSVDETGILTALAGQASSAMVTATSQGITSAPTTVRVASSRVLAIALSSASLYLCPTEEAQLTAVGTYDDGTRGPLIGATWTSTNPAAAVVDANGYVTGVALGDAEVIVTAGGTSATAILTVEYCEPAQP